MFRRIKFVFYAFCLLCGLVCFLSFCSHGSPSEDIYADSVSHRLRVLTYNTHMLGMYRPVADNQVIAYLLSDAQDADIVCLQEVTLYRNSRHRLTKSQFDRTMRRKYRYIYYDLLSQDNRPLFGNVILSRYPLKNLTSITPSSSSNRSAFCDVYVDGDTVRLFVNHMTSYRFTSSDGTDQIKQKFFGSLAPRREQVRLVCQSIASSPYPAIVVGDFNALPLSYTYWRMRIAGLQDAFLQTSWFRYGRTYVWHLVPMRIDYLFSSSSIYPLDCAVQPPTCSDHFPLAATFVW